MLLGGLLQEAERLRFAKDCLCGSETSQGPLGQDRVVRQERRPRYFGGSL